jgi:hypothetical protein
MSHIIALSSLILAILFSTTLTSVNITLLPNSATARAIASNMTSLQPSQAEASSASSNFSITKELNIPTGESIYQSQSMSLPTSVGTFVWYIVNEAHENAVNERHKYVSNNNPIYLPTNLVIPQGTAITFLDADAPWDTPHPHTINVIDNTGKVVYSTGKMDYTNSSVPKVLPAGKYTLQDTKYTWMVGNLTVNSNQRSTGNLVVGGFYTPTNQVANNKDNDGGSHPGWLGYYKEQFPKNGFKILSTFDFHYATCKYCPGGFWPDQKAADHTLIIYSTTQSVTNVLSKLSKLVWNNVYI